MEFYIKKLMRRDWATPGIVEAAIVGIDDLGDNRIQSRVGQGSKS